MTKPINLADETGCPIRVRFPEHQIELRFRSTMCLADNLALACNELERLTGLKGNVNTALYWAY